MKPKKIVIHIEGEVNPEDLHDRTFQVHHVTGNTFSLYEVVLTPPDTQCPVVIYGERCGCKAGHEGKHMWADGD